MLRWFVCVLAMSSLVLAFAGEASADRVKRLTRQLSKSRSAKVRISAALSLAKSNDARAVSALTRALKSDRTPAIRRVAAASLGQRLSRKISRSSRKKIVAALTRARKKDRDSKVRSSAKVALAKGELGATPRPRQQSQKRGIMVGVVAPKNVSRRLPKQTAALLQSQVKQVIKKQAPRSVHTTPGTGMPASSQLASRGLTGYLVSPNISKLKLRRRGAQVLVTCEIKMRLAPWAGAGDRLQIQKTATVTGSGTVSSGSSKQAIALSSQACIEAVVTQVTANQVVPFLTAQTR